MTIESGTYISDLNVNYPETNALISGGDNHIRWIKVSLKATFPSIAGAITASHTTINSSIASVVAATSSNTANSLVKRDASGNISAGAISGTSFTSAGNMNLGDDNKLVFGAGSDLQIHHNSNGDSFIDEVGSGSLFVRADNFYLRNAADESYLVGVSNGPVSLYYDDAQKLATTATGIDVAGTATMNSLNVNSGTLQVDATNNRVGVNTSPGHALHINSGSTDCVGQFESSDANAYISLKDSSTTHTLHGIGAVGNDLALYANNAERMRIDSAGTATFEGNVGIGIGTSSPTAELDVLAGADQRLLFTTLGTDPFISAVNGANSAYKSLQLNGSDMKLMTGGSERMRIDSAGAITAAGPITAAGAISAHNATFDNGTSTLVDVISDDNGKSELRLYGSNQGTGRLFVGQDTTYGGGIEYNGDSVPVTSGAGTDYTALFRRSNNTDYWTARNFHNNNNWEFRATVTAPTFSGSLSGNASSADNSTSWGGYKISTSQSGSSSDTIYFRT